MDLPDYGSGAPDVRASVGGRRPFAPVPLNLSANEEPWCALTCLRTDKRRWQTEFFLKRYSDSRPSNIKEKVVPIIGLVNMENRDLQFRAFIHRFCPIVFSC